MEIQMPQGAHVIDLEATHFKALQSVAGCKGAGGSTFRTGLAEHPLRFQITPDRGVGGQV